MTTLILACLLGQAPYSRMVGQPSTVREPAPARVETFAAHPTVPPAWRIRRAVVEVKPKADPAPEPPPILGRSIPERVETLEWSMQDVLRQIPGAWHPTPRIALAADPPAVRGGVPEPFPPPKVGMPPPGVPERVDLQPVIDRLDRVEARLAEILAKVEAHAVQLSKPPAAAPCNPNTCQCSTSGVCVNPAACQCPNCPARKQAPARMPAAATPPPRTATVMADRYGRLWDDSVSGYDGLVRWVEQQNAAAAYTASQPYFALPVGDAFGVCGPNGCGPAAGFGRGLFGGRFR